MRIAVLPMSPRVGVTSSALLIGMALAYKQSKLVRLCFTGDNPQIKRYMGRDEDERDVTRSISQVSKLLQARAISAEELSNYCVKLGPNFELMDSYAESLTRDEMEEILSFVFQRSTSDITMCDLTDGYSNPITSAVLKECDTVIYVCTPHRDVLEEVQKFRESEFYKTLNPQAHQMLLVNNYSAVIMPLKKCAFYAGMALRDTCKIHYNPYISKGAENRDLQSVAVSAFDKDWRVIELYRDLLECTQFILSATGEKIRWED